MAVRRVRRVVRKIDPWTVLKVSVIFNAIAGLIFVLGVWVMWSLAIQRGLPDRITEFFANFALVFNAEGELYFRVVVLLTIIGVVVFTGLLTLGAVMYNLISDVVGGVEVIVLEETYAVAPARQAPVRPAVHMPTTAEIDTVADDSAAVLDEESTDEDEEDEEAPAAEEPLDWTSPVAVDEDIEDIEEPEAIEEDVVDDDITVEEDAIPVGDDEELAAASEG
jgi:hypothetical protein